MTHEPAEVLAVLRTYVALADEDTPLELDSLTLVELVEALEDELGVRVPGRVVTAEHFATARTIAALLGRL